MGLARIACNRHGNARAAAQRAVKFDCIGLAHAAGAKQALLRLI